MAARQRFGRCPLSVRLCNFEVARHYSWLWLAITDDKQRERAESGSVMMASGLHT
jgi:hypothetical protein